MKDQNQKFELKAFLLILAFAFLVFFAQNRSFLLMFDGLTYVALAKNILKTGDWKTLHYSLEQYPNFFQHPPLAIWMQALVFKVLGYSEPVSRILSSAFSLAAVGFVFWFTRIFYGVTAAFWAGVVLISSTRFIKWGTNFYLDGILAFFCFAGSALWVVEMNSKQEFTEPRSFGRAFFAGLLLSCGLMTKGLIALSGFAVVALAAVLYFNKKNILKLIPFFIGVAVPLLLWILLGDGLNYIDEYLSMSALGRVRTSSLIFEPWNNLITVWWPWLPLFILAPYFVFKKIKKSSRADSIFGTRSNTLPVFIMGVGALSFPIGFSFGNIYLEHYLTPFYPYAAVVVGVVLSLMLPPLSEKGVNIGYRILLVTALFVATLAPSFHYIKPSAVSRWITELETLPAESQAQIKQIAFTEKSCEIWYCMANVLAKTEWQVYGNFAPSRAVIPETVLISLKDERPAPSWKEIPCLYVEGFKAYSSAGVKWCK